MRRWRWLVAGLTCLALVGPVVLGAFYLAPETATHLALATERRLAGLERREIELPDGLRYVYLEGGRRDAEPLLLLHGFGADKDNFVRVSRYLGAHYRLIVPDHIGFGESSHPPEVSYTPSAQVARLRQLTSALGLGNLHLGGSSMGGQIALTWAAAYPAEIASLWLLDPAGIWSAPPSELFSRLSAGGENPLLADSPRGFAATFAFVMNDPPFVPGPMLDVLARPRIANHALEQRIFREISTDSVESRAAGLTTPALVVFGARDRVLHPDSGAILTALMPHASQRVMPEIGHLPMLEAPYACANDYLAFRAGLTATPTMR